MLRIFTLSLLLSLTLVLGGCGKKKSSKTKKPQQESKAVPMAPSEPSAPHPMARPAAMARPARPTPIPPKVKLAPEAEKLATVVEKALRANKPDAVVALVPNRDALKGCPRAAKAAAQHLGSLEKTFAHTQKQIRAAFKRCAALGSWAKARRTEARQTKMTPEPVDGCKRLVKHGHIYLAYVIGGKSVTVKLAAPARVEGKRWVLLDGLRCRLGGDLYR